MPRSTSKEARSAILEARRQYLHRRGLVLPLRIVRRPSDRAPNLLHGRCRVVLDAALASQKVRMILSLLFVMNKTSMTRVTLVALVTTQQAQLVPVGAAALPS